MLDIVFYKYQLLAGTLLGCYCAAVGVFVLLKQQSVFGVTLSQAVSCAVAVSIIFGWRGVPHSLVPGDVSVLLITVLFMLPLFLINIRQPANISAILIVGLVFFAALSQILLAVGGQVQVHLLSAFFGNIITTGAGELSHLWFPGLLILGLYIYFYRTFAATAFDRDHARLSGVKANITDFIFFLMLSYVLSEAINLMGSFYTLAHLIIPGLLALALSRSLRATIFIAVIFSAISTVGGFMISLVKLPVGPHGLNLPTSSTIIILMVLGLVVLTFRRRDT